MHIQPIRLFLIYIPDAYAADTASNRYLPIYNPHSHSADITENTDE